MIIRPHVYFLVAAAKAPLQAPVTILNTKVPTGAPFRLDFMLVQYPLDLTGEGGDVQDSPNIQFTLLNTRGIAHNNVPVNFPLVTNPGPRSTLRASWYLGIEWPANAYITLQVSKVGLGPDPARISVTYLSQKGWGER
jgi:hypothetical protein